MIRSIVKDAAAHAASWTGVNKVARTKLHREVPFIVSYHRVVDRLNVHGPAALPAMEVSVSMLEKHIDWIGRHFEIVSLDDLPKRLGRRVRSKPVASFTFDDGYSDVFHHGLPLLKRKGIPAGIFVVTDLVGTKEVPVHEHLHALFAQKWPSLTPKFFGRTPFAATQSALRNLAHDRVLELIEELRDGGGSSRPPASTLQTLTWEMLIAMRDAGMTIGSHSATHAFLTNESPERVQHEAAASRSVLQQRLAVKANCFAYPGGDFNPAVVNAVDAAGYTMAFTICRHRDSRYPTLTLPRCGMWEQSCLDRLGRFSSAILSSHTSGMFGSASYCPNRH